MNYAIAIAVAGLGGFLALSYEIVWIRIYSFITAGTAATFGVVLGAFLIGTAAGSLASRGYCRKRLTGDPALLNLVAMLLILASLAAFALVPLVARAVTVVAYPWTLVGITLVAALLGAILPLLSHFGIAPDQRTGSRVAILYLANIIGSTAGPLVTGFVVLDHLTVAQMSPLLAGVGLVAAAAITMLAGTRGRRAAVVLVLTALVIVVAVVATPALFADVWGRLLFKRAHVQGSDPPSVIENRSGVIAVADGVVYGGGIYDGQINVGLDDDRNLVTRAYALSALHPAPRHVLFIGLGSGSWAQVIANNPTVEEITIIDINPGYIELAASNPQTRSLIDNPKVTIVIDDARRWLRRNPGRRFDAIVANITFHWRAHATLLLSQEFLEFIRGHLAPGGIYYYNTTGSTNAQKTACTSYRYGYRVFGFIAVSDSPMAPDRDRLRDVITAYRIDGRPVLDLDRTDHRERLEDAILLGEGERVEAGKPWLESCEEILERAPDHWIVTDDSTFLEWSKPWWWTFQPTPGH